MGGPWEKFQNAEPAPSQAPAQAEGPWTKFQEPAIVAESQPTEETPQLNSFERGLAQGATFGHQDEASGMTEAAMGAVDSLVNGSNSFGDQGRLGGVKNVIDNYARARDTQRDQLAADRDAHPVLEAAGEILGSIPLSIATRANSNLTRTGLAGATYGLGSSSKESAGQTALDTSIGGLIAIATGGLAKLKGNKIAPAVGEEFNNLGLGKKVIDTLNPENVGITSKIRPNGDFDIKFGGGLKDAFTLSKDSKKFLGNDTLKASVTDEVNNIFGTADRPGNIPQLIDQTKSRLGVARDGVLKNKGALSTDVESPFKKAFDRIKTYDTGGDVEKENALKDLTKRLGILEDNLLAKSPSGSLKDVPLLHTFETKQDLGEKLFGVSQLYRKAPDAKNIVQKLWGDLGNVAGKSDPEVKTLTDAFSTLYKMESNAINSPVKMKALTSPTAGPARAAYKDFIDPMLKLDPNTRASLMPELQEYIAVQMPKTLNKQAVLNSVNSSADAKGGMGWVLNKLYLNQSSLYSAAGTAGAASNIPASAANVGLSGLRGAANVSAPALGGFSAQPLEQRALKELK
jgi:hypothetical protein